MSDPDVLRRLENLEEKMDLVLTFVDECSGGRKALLLFLKVTGSCVAILAAFWGMFKAGILKPWG